MPDAVLACSAALNLPPKQLGRSDTARSSGESNDTTRPPSADAVQPAKDSGESHATVLHVLDHHGVTPAPQPTKPEDKKTGDRPQLPRPEGHLPCPRCSSSDTKFCYYNNYNVNQPRYYCKGCQRYWTAGGTLRNVPPGSCKRKNKSARKASTELPVPVPAQPLPYAGIMLGDQLYKAGIKPTDAAALAAAVPFMPTPGVQLGVGVPALPTMQSAFAQAPPMLLKPADASGPLPVLSPGFASATLPPLPVAPSIPLHTTASLPILPPAVPNVAALTGAMTDSTVTEDGAQGRRVLLRTLDSGLASAPPSGELTSDTGLSSRDTAPEWLTNYHQQAALIYGAQNAAYGFGWPYGLYGPQSWAVQQYAARYVEHVMRVHY